MADSSKNVGMLAYAVPDGVADERRTLSPIQVDPGPFLLVGQEFDPGRGIWQGPALASPSAIYLVKVLDERLGGDGILGVARLFQPLDDIRSCQVAVLPSTVLAALGMREGSRLHRKQQDKDVIVLLRPSVTKVVIPWIDNYADVWMGSTRLRIYIPAFRNWRLKRRLNALGWPVNQRSLSPSVHGSPDGGPAPVAEPAAGMAAIGGGASQHPVLVHGEGYGRRGRRPGLTATQIILRTVRILTYVGFALVVLVKALRGCR